MENTKKYTGKINTDVCKLFISDNNNIEGYLVASILYKKDKMGAYENQIGIFDIKNNILKTEEDAIEWADNWIQDNFQTSPNFIAE